MLSQSLLDAEGRSKSQRKYLEVGMLIAFDRFQVSTSKTYSRVEKANLSTIGREESV